MRSRHPAKSPEDAIREAFSQYEYRTLPGVISDTGLSEQQVEKFLKELGGEVLTNWHKAERRVILRYMERADDEELILEMTD